jgi:hypothetical protein
MRKSLRLSLIVVATAALVLGFLAAVKSMAMPLGVRGEWEWLRLKPDVAVLPIDLALGAVWVAGYAVFAALGTWTLAARATRVRALIWVVLLAVAAVAVQERVQSAAPAGYGLSKWVVALSQSGSSGYIRLAREEAADLGLFLARYPAWIRTRDALHIGTHPPGLVASEALLLRALQANPGATRWVEGHAPEPVVLTLRFFGENNPLPPAERAAYVLTGAITLLFCALTVLPLYKLARESLTPSRAFAVAALWPLVPSAVLFQPTADTAFPLLSTTALALAVHAGRAGSRSVPWRAGAAGVMLGVGMQFSLVFLAVGAVVGIVLITAPVRSWWERVGRVMAAGAGFVGLTLLVWAVTHGNPFLTWWWNEANHARFYAEFPRSYLPWVVANPIELAVGLGLPAAVWALVSLRWWRAVPGASVATIAILAALTLGGWNLSEVGRLWLPFMPALLLAVGVSFEKLGAGPKTLAATIAVTGTQILALQAMIQVVYPV